jgi:hypothetical protein
VGQDQFVFPERWWDLRGHTAEEAAGRERVERELRRELAEGHVLYGIDAVAIAACNGHCDDVLFALENGRFALVHLSYPDNAPDRPPWPDTDIFDDWEQAAAYAEDHADW